MRRRLALLGLWLVATAGATLVVWLGVRVVDGEVTGSEPAALATDEAGAVTSTTATSTTTTMTPLPGGPATSAPGPAGPGAPVATTAPAGVPPTTVAPAPPPPATTTAASTRTVRGEGGSLTVRSTATTVELVSATPNDGFTAEVEKQGPSEVRVLFGRDDHTTEIRVLPGGAPPDVRESGGGGSGPG